MGPLPIKDAKSIPSAENLNTLFMAKGKKFELSAQGSDLTPLVGNETKVKIPSEIKLPLPIMKWIRICISKKHFVNNPLFCYQSFIAKS